jgi:quercetin dioxygenase-like cupin family protein
VPALVVRRAAERFVTRSPGVETRHGFSSGPHYDPEHVAHGRLVAHDEHVLAPFGGFDPHKHRDLEVVSWVLAGALVHEEGGRREVVPAGDLQRMTAGDGVVHAERAAEQATRFLQLWLTTGPAQERSYERVVVRGLSEVLPGLHVGRLDGAWTVPDLPRAHLHVAGGACVLGGLALGAGDAVRLTAAGPWKLRGQAQLLLVDVSQE